MTAHAKANFPAYLNHTERLPVVPRFLLNYNAFAYLRKLLSHKPAVTDGLCSRFASRVALHFPEIANRIDEADFGVLHLEVGELKLATRDAILRRDWDEVVSHYAFVAELLATAGDELRDALHVSYLGNLFYGELAVNYAKARCLLPRPLSVALEKIERHYEQLIP